MDRILTLCQILKNAGHQCLMVGGAVRSQILGDRVKDFDFATSASVEEMLSLFKGQAYTIVPTGLKHGTLTLVMEGQHFELTTFRGDNFEEDSCHRDFTINAIYYDPLTQKYFDPQHGVKSLEDKVLCFIGPPLERIEEDFLRCFRLFRFMSTLGFSCEKHSLQAALENFPKTLQTVSVERLRDELLKLLEGSAFDKVLKSFPEIFLGLLPSGKTELALANLPETRPLLRLASFYVDSPLRDLESLKFSHREMKYVSFIIDEVENLPCYQNRKAIRRLVVKAQEMFSDEALVVLKDLSLISTLRAHHSFELDSELKLAPWNYKSPLNGKEIQEMTGLDQGKIVGEIKEYLLDCVLEGELSVDDKVKARNLVLDYLKK